jgi:bacterioferritin-associated ferredoxin
MSAHLTDKEIDNFAAGTASAEDVKKVREHLAECGKCRKTADALASLVEKQPVDFVPGDHVREAVIAGWHRLHTGTVLSDSLIKPPLKRYPRVLAFAASVVIAAASYLIYDKVKINEINDFALSSITGEVMVNDSAAAGNVQLRSSDVIKTGKDASASASADKYKLYIGRSSSLKVLINSSREIRFRLNEGSVISKSNGNINYSFECGGYTVTPAGTEFLLTFSEDKLSAAVLNGKIIITGKNLSIEIASGMKWTSVNPAIIEILDSGTSSLINSVPSGVWPDKSLSENSRNRSLEPGDKADDAAEPKSDTQSSDSRIENAEKDKQEKSRIKRELRDEMNEIKKEQRREKKGRNND